MEKVRLYILLFVGISIVTLVAGIGACSYCYHTAREAIWNHKMESGRRETREIGRLLEEQLDNGQPPQKVIDNLQQSIVNTDAQSEFVCMYDTNGIELCHPDPALVGQKIDAGNSLFIRNGSPAPFSDILHLGKAGTGLRSFPVAKHRSSEIVTVYPVKGSDWMVAAHANVTVLQAQLDNLYHQFMVGIILMVLLISGSCFLLIRLIYGKYERQMDQEILRLNKDLAAKKVAESTRKRLVTYQRDEMVSLEVGDIAFIFLSENSVFVQTFLNQRHTVNTSLDELMKQLDNDIFYRANRQCIVNVNAIKTILVYGKNQLQLVMHPQAPEEIIISKNKAAEFKDWLDR